MLARQLFDCDLQQLIDIDKEFLTCDSEIRDWDRPASELLSEIHAENESNEETESVCESKPICTRAECFNYIEKLKQFAASQGKGVMLDTVVDMEEILLKMKMDSCSKQKRISDVFQKK